MNDAEFLDRIERRCNKTRYKNRVVLTREEYVRLMTLRHGDAGFVHQGWERTHFKPISIINEITATRWMIKSAVLNRLKEGIS